MKIHLIGVGGTGMGAVAGLLVEAGHEVRGSDEALYPPMSTMLERLGIPVFVGYCAENLDWLPERVVVGNICRKDHVEVLAAQARALPLTSFPALLEETFLSARHNVVVAGTHGKTTTTTMLAHLLSQCGLNPGYLVGGVPRDLNESYAAGQEPYFVIEGDEYDTAFFDKRPKFVHYRPRTVILTSVEFDHADIYADLPAVERAFDLLIARVPADGTVVVCADGALAVAIARRGQCKVVTYSVTQAADYFGALASEPGGRQRVTITRAGASQPVATLSLSVAGEHNAENALGAFAAAVGVLGCDPAQAAEALARFSGVRRRQDVVGCFGGVTVIDDFAHHPTAIKRTLDGLRAAYPTGKLIAVFEPRSATSRRNVLAPQLGDALRAADAALIGPLHDVSRIPEAERLSPARVADWLIARGQHAAALASVEAIVDELCALSQPGDTVVVMSSGSFGGLIPRLQTALALR